MNAFKRIVPSLPLFFRSWTRESLGMAAHELLGRDRELEAIDGFLAAACVGPATLAIEGEAGIGKTSLWREALERAAGLGIQVYSCRPASAEAKLSFSALADLLEPVPDAAFAALPAPQRHALEVALLRIDPQGGSPDARAAATAVRSLMTALAAEEPVLIAIDDVQWLDVSSARALDFALRRVVEVCVSLVVAKRTGTSSARLETVLADVDHLPVGPLSLAATHELLKNRLGRSIPRRILMRVHEAAAGNPFYALEIARAVVEQEHQGTGPLPVPDDLAGVVLRRLRRLRPDAREALVVVAAADRPSTGLVESVLGEGRGGIDDAKDAGLLHEDRRVLRLEHPLYGAAVYSAASEQQRREVHRRLAEAVDEPEERVRHLALAAPGADGTVSAALRSAAESAKARGALDAAAELVELALRLAPDPESESGLELKLDLALLIRLTGDTDRARKMFDEIVQESSGELLGQALVEFAGALYWSEGSVAGVKCLERALGATEGYPMLQARAHADLAMYCDFDLERSYRHAQAALQLCVAAGNQADPFVHCEALSLTARGALMLGKGLNRCDLDEAVEMEKRATETEPSVAVVGRMTTTSGQWLKYVDDFEESRARLENARREALDEGDESALPNILHHLAHTELWSGNWRRASEYAETAYDMAFELGQRSGGPAAARALVDAHLGNVARARETATEGLSLVGENPLAAPLFLRVLGFLELSLDNAAAAAEFLTQALEHLNTVRILEPGVLRLHGDAVEALIGSGDRERAEAVLVPWEEQAARIDLAWSVAVAARSRALLEAALGRGNDALEALNRAMSEHERLSMPFELGRTLLVRGQIERRLKRRAAAKKSLEAALEVFGQLGAPLWEEKARAESARVGLRRSSDDLTEGERRVAELAASGLTNREVAARLYMSPKTVEANLARAYRKLGIHSRAELGARLAGVGDSGPQA
jgi:DNA-binding CsgD family transcriptional regulator